MPKAKRQFKPSIHRSVRVPIELDEIILRNARRSKRTYAQALFDIVREGLAVNKSTIQIENTGEPSLTEAFPFLNGYVKDRPAR